MDSEKRKSRPIPKGRARKQDNASREARPTDRPETDQRSVGLRPDLESLRWETQERERAEAALKRSERDYRHLVESAHDAILIFRPEDEVVLEVNQRACEFYGFGRPEFIGMSLEKITHDIPRGKVQIQATLDQGFYHHFESVHYRKDGSKMFVEINGSRVNYQGRWAIQSINRDITERKRAEEQVKSQYSILQAIIGSTDALIFSLDRDYRYTSFNKNHAAIMKAIYGVDIEIGRSLLDYMKVEEDRNTAKGNLDRALQGERLVGEAYSGLEEMSRRYFEVSHNPIRTPEGEVIGVAVLAKDLTERQRAEEALQESEEKYRLLFENANDAIFLHEVSREGPRKIFAANEAACLMLGYTREELLRMTIADIDVPEHTEEIPAILDRLFSEGNAVAETELLRKDGSRVPVLGSIRTFDLHGTKVMLSIVRDITERKRIEAGLRRSEEHFRTLTENSSDAVIVVDKKGIITYVSPSIERVMGYKPEELIGESGFNFIALADLPRAVIDFGKAVLITESIIPNAFHVRHKDGSERIVEGVGRSLFDNPAVAGFVMNVRDVTERQQAERARRESEERFRTLFENTAIGLYRTTPDGRILMANPALVRILGYATFEELAKRNLEENGYAPSFPRSDFRQQVEREGQVVGLESAWRRRDGGLLFVRESARAVRDQEGKVLYYEGTAEDVTERKRAEEALRDSERKHRTLLENLPQKIFFKDRNSVYLSCNENYARDLKIHSDEIRGQTDYDFFPRDLAEKYRSDDRRIMESGRSEDIEERYLQEGQERWVHTVKTPVKNDEGEVFGVLGIFWDITERKRAEEERDKTLLWQQGVNLLQQSLLAPALLEDKLRSITDSIVRLFDADFCRIWLIRPGDLCERGCIHAEVNEGPHICRYRDRCLHLLASSGRYTHTDGKTHRRVPFGCYKIGRVASGEDHKFLTNDVQNDPRVHNHEWARDLGLVSFGGFQLRVPGGETIGVLALFAKHPILSTEEAMLDGLSSTIALVVQRAVAEEALHKSEAKYRELVENANSIILRRDPEGRITFFNEFAQRFFGYREEEILGRNVVGTIVPEKESSGRDLAQMIRDISRHPERYATNENENVLRNGERVWVAWTNKPILDPDGKLAEILCIGNNITDRKRAEERLAESEVKYRTLVEGMSEAVIQVDNDHVVQFVNPQFCQMVGYREDELLGRVGYEIYFDPEEQEMIRRKNRLRREKVSDAYETRMRKKNGEEVLVRISGSPVTDAQGNVAGSIGVITDITAHKRAEQAVKESETKYRGIVDHSLLGIYITQGHIMRFCNQRLAEIFGYERSEELIGTYVRELVAPESWEAVDTQVQRRESGELDTVRYEFKGKRRDGALIDLEVLGGRILYEGMPAIQGSMIEVTERKLLEAEFLQAQKMEALGRLAGGVAHDFNNLLTSIMGYSDLLAKKLTEDDPSGPLRRYADNILSSANRAANLTQQLLSLSRRHAAQMLVLDLNGVVAEVERMLRRVIGEDIELTIHSEGTLGRVKADPIQIEQVLMNLAVNARDAMPHGGRLSIRTANVLLDKSYVRRRREVAPGPYVMIAVSDTGHGMNAEVQSHLFEPFFTTKEKGKGTGLGLSTAYGIVKQTGGHIEVESAPGKGSAFKIYLPRTEEPPAPLSSPQPQPPGPVEAEFPRGVETVLLAEDEETVRSLAREVLRGAGYTVLEAGDGEEALRVAGSHPGPIHLLLTDVIMPRLGGPALARHLQPLRPDMRVLFMSGYTDGDISSYGALGSETSLLQKPFQPMVLARRVREVLEAP